jgi:hypothetical protein
MKFIIALVIVSFSIATNAQTPVLADSLFVVTYTTGPAWDHTKSPGEQIYFKEHSANLSKLRKEGVIKAGARYGEKGMIFISAQSLALAKEIIQSDLAVINKLFIADIQKLLVFYDGCLERPK